MGLRLESESGRWHSAIVESIYGLRRICRRRDLTGAIAVFWGSPDLGFVNINMLQHQQMPLLIELNDPERCVRDQITKNKDRCQYSVSEECPLTVYSVMGDA